MAKPIGRWFRVGDVLRLFQQMGCDLVALPGHIVGDNGDQLEVRYVLNHENGRFFAVVDLSDDDRVPETQVRDWMRQAGVDIPLPPSPQ